LLWGAQGCGLRRGAGGEGRQEVVEDGGGQLRR
jgi:hypothetical protein